MKKNKNYVDLKDQPVPEGQHLLEVDDLKMYFHTEDGVVRAVDGVSYTLDRGETLGLLGQTFRMDMGYAYEKIRKDRGRRRSLSRSFYPRNDRGRDAAHSR
jgi:hypothetical protein